MEGSEEKSERHKPRQQCSVVADAESGMNLALTDPPRWGWTAAGTIADLLPPHEVRTYISLFWGCRDHGHRRGIGLLHCEYFLRSVSYSYRDHADVALPWLIAN